MASAVGDMGRAGPKGFKLGGEKRQNITGMKGAIVVEGRTVMESTGMLTEEQGTHSSN